MTPPANTLSKPLLVLTALLAWPAAADPGPRPGDLRLGWSIHVGGIHVLDATGHLGLDGQGYRVGIQAETNGFLGRVANWQADVAAHGSLGADGLPRPALYRSVSAWQDRPRNTTVAYGPDGLPQVLVAEPPPEEDREPVPDRLKADTVDPLSATVAALLSVAAGQGCGVKMPVYDGRQRYDIALEPKGREVLEANSLSVFAGAAEACRIRYIPVAGRWRDDGSRRDRDGEGRRRDPDVTIWLASPQPGAAPVPVLLQSDSPLGRVVVHLSKVETIRPGETAEQPQP